MNFPQINSKEFHVSNVKQEKRTDFDRIPLISNFQIQIPLIKSNENLILKSSQNDYDDSILIKDEQPQEICSEYILQKITNLFLNSQISKEELNKFIDLKFMNSYIKFINQKMPHINYTKKKDLLLQLKESVTNDENISNTKKETSSRLRRMKFSEKEDEMLKMFVNKLGSKNWRLISSMMPGRNQKQCRDRYMNYLAPDLVRTQWTNEEDDLLIEKYKIYGSKWSKIRQFFPKRTSNDIKNRFNYTLSRKIENIENNDFQKSLYSKDQKYNLTSDPLYNINLIEVNNNQFYFDNDELKINDLFERI